MKNTKVIAASAVCVALLTGGAVLAFGQARHQHAFNSRWSSDDSRHWLSCSCGEIRNADDHSVQWIVDAEPTTDAEGAQHPECSVCDYVGAAVSMPKIHVHTPEAPHLSDENAHWQQCVCGEKMNPAAHAMEWIIDRAATSTTDGEKHPECTVCGLKGESVPIHIHTALKEWYNNDTQHWQLCRCGEKMNVIKHTSQYIIDREATATTDGLRHTLCKTCGFEGKQESFHVHFAGETLHNDHANHWNLCRCGQKMNMTKHALQYVIDREATADADGLRHTLCKTCSFEGKQESFHVHFAGETLHSDKINHWNLCRCGQKMNITKHALQYVIDREATADADGLRHTLCKTCSFESQQESFHVHFAGEALYRDKANHWNLCRCGNKMNVLPHDLAWIIDVPATATTEGTRHQACNVCSHALAPVYMPTTRYSAFDVGHAIDAAVAQYRSLGLQVATIKNGRLSFVQSYGWAEKNTRPMTDDTKVRIASPTKVIVGMCAMSMVDAGLLDLDAPLSTYWGEGVQNAYHPKVQPTMRHLLTHTSSLKEWDSAGKSAEYAEKERMELRYARQSRYLRLQ